MREADNNIRRRSVVGHIYAAMYAGWIQAVDHARTLIERLTSPPDQTTQRPAGQTLPSIRQTSSQHCSRSGAPSSLAVQSIHSILGRATTLVAAAASGKRIYDLMVIKYRGDTKMA